MPTVEQNIFWDSYPWVADGDEWQDQAGHCGQPYFAWKAALVEKYIRPYVTGKHVVEIGPGHGRWTAHILAAGATSLHLVDLSQTCLDYLADRFVGAPISFHASSGSDLAASDATKDVVFSYDALVHCEWTEIAGYIAAASRALVHGGFVVLHTPGRGAVGGHRGEVNADQVASAIRASGFDLVEQTDHWGDHNQYTCSLFGDVITVARKT